MNSSILDARAYRVGQPDAFCDRVAGLIRDAHLRGDSESDAYIRVAASPGLIVVSGEARSRARVDYEDIVWDAIADTGYLTRDLCPPGRDEVEIRVCVNQKRHKNNTALTGRGETRRPANCAEALAIEICEEIDEMQYRADWLCPDGGAEAVVLYENGLPAALMALTIHAQHAEEASPEFVRREIRREIVESVVPRALINGGTRIEINPQGAFVLGGPAAKAGVSGGGFARRAAPVGTNDGAIYERRAPDQLSSAVISSGSLR